MFKKKVKVFFYTLVSLAVVLFSVGNCKKAPVVDEWRVPVILFLSGPLAGDAIVHKWLMDETVKDINASGGISGKPLVLEYLDSALDPSKATAAMAKAIDMKALCILGPFTDFEVQSAMPLAVREGIFAFGGSGETAKNFLPWTLHTTQTREDMKKHLMPLWINKVKGIKHAVTFVEPIFTALMDFAKDHKETMSKMGVETTIIEIPVMKVDYSPSVVKALNTGADAFTFWSSQQTTAKIVKELVRRKVNPNKIWISGMSIGQAFYNEAGKAAEGVFSMESQSWAFTPKYTEYNKRYNKEHPGQWLQTFTYVTYDMIHMVKNAIEAQGITGDPAKLKEEREKIKDYALNQKGFKGIKYTFDVVNGIGHKVPLNLFQARDGKEVLVDSIISE